MKPLALFISMCLMACTAFSQVVHLAVTTNKTTSIVFPFTIKHADRGTKDLLVQPVPEADNILLVKAAAVGFPETNLTVITSDGHLYTFLVNYSEAAPTLYYQVPASASASVETVANHVLDNPALMHHVRSQRGSVKAVLSGIYIKDSILYYQIHLENKSPITYDMEALRFFIQDKKRLKRSAVQEQELTPLYIAGNTRQVQANSHNTMVVALDKFTVADQKVFHIKVLEKNGGRNLNLAIQNRNILKARLLE